MLKFRMIWGALVAVFATCFGSHAGMDEHQSRKPNILLMISDDQGYGEFGFTGNEIAETPNLDRLSSQSAFYSNFIVSPGCAPTRSTLMTGRHHLLTGTWGVGPRGNTHRDETLMPSFFNPSGYDTWLSGKHDGTAMMELDPDDRGFDWFCLIGGGYLQRNPIMYGHHQGETVEGWTVDIMTEDVISQIRSAGDTPWLAYVAYIIPHLPWETYDHYADPYREQGFSESISQLYGSIAQMDESIGRLLDVLEEEGQKENTIVVFLSDDGPTEGRPAWVNDGFRHAQHSSDWGLRNPHGLTGQKGEIWDHGIRSPLLIRWPGKIEPGNRSQFGSVEDILPTLLDLADIDPETWPDHHPFTGMSLYPSLKETDHAVDREVMLLALAGPGEPGTVAKGGVIENPEGIDYTKLHVTLRGDRYKFHHMPGGDLRLYDLHEDPGEKNDISSEHPELTKEMAERCREQWDDFMKSGRTFWMANLRINNIDDPGRTSWFVPTNQMEGLSGDVVSVFTGGCRGFKNPGDTAEYKIDVQKAGEFSFKAVGRNFDRSAGFKLVINGDSIVPEHRGSEEVLFGTVELPAGFSDLTIKVPPSSEPGEAEAFIQRILVEKH